MNNIESLNITQDQYNTIVQSLEDNDYSVFKVMKELVISRPLVEYVNMLRTKAYNMTPSGRGPVNLQKYLIASRLVFNSQGETGSSWDNKDPKIKKAREDYNNGLVEIVTGRDGLVMNLYAIPRETQGKTRTYFEVDSNV